MDRPENLVIGNVTFVAASPQGGGVPAARLLVRHLSAGGRFQQPLNSDELKVLARWCDDASKSCRVIIQQVNRNAARLGLKGRVDEGGQ